MAGVPQRVLRNVPPTTKCSAGAGTAARGVRTYARYRHLCCLLCVVGGRRLLQGVVCGNEAVWTVEPSDGDKALLGMDLVR